MPFPLDGTVQEEQSHLPIQPGPAPVNPTALIGALRSKPFIFGGHAPPLALDQLDPDHAPHRARRSHGRRQQGVGGLLPDAGDPDQQAERDEGKRAGMSTSERERLKQLERENLELKRANEILRTASAYFAQAELDRRRK